MSNPRDKNQQDRSETIRGHLEAQVREGCIYGGACDHPDPMQCCPGCRARVRARAMLAILSEADERRFEDDVAATLRRYLDALRAADA